MLSYEKEINYQFMDLEFRKFNGIIGKDVLHNQIENVYYLSKLFKISASFVVVCWIFSIIVPYILRK